MQYTSAEERRLAQEAGKRAMEEKKQIKWYDDLAAHSSKAHTNLDKVDTSKKEWIEPHPEILKNLDEVRYRV